MAVLKNTQITSTNSINLPKGTTAERPVSPIEGQLYYNTDLKIVERCGPFGWISPAGQTPETAVPSAKALKEAYPYLQTNYYWLSPNGLAPARYYCDMNYDGGGWVMVMSHFADIGSIAYQPSMPYVTYSDGVNIGRINGIGTSRNIEYTNVWTGLRFYTGLGLNVVQVGHSSPQPIGSCSNRYRWTYTGFSANYGFTGAVGVADETGTGAPGLLTFHATGGYGLTTFDVDNDTNSGNCSTQFGNSPFWYGSCWSGSMWGGGAQGGSYAQSPYWTGSSTPINYMAVYLKV